MVEYNTDRILTDIFKAVSDTTRRSLLQRLCRYGPQRVTDLAKSYETSLNAVSKHIKVLEEAGLVQRTTVGRTHLIEAKLMRVKLAEKWFTELKSIWALRLDKLDEIIHNGGPEND